MLLCFIYQYLVQWKIKTKYLVKKLERLQDLTLFIFFSPKFYIPFLLLILQCHDFLFYTIHSKVSNQTFCIKKVLNMSVFVRPVYTLIIPRCCKRGLHVSVTILQNCTVGATRRRHCVDRKLLFTKTHSCCLWNNMFCFGKICYFEFKKKCYMLSFFFSQCEGHYCVGLSSETTGQSPQKCSLFIHLKLGMLKAESVFYFLSVSFFLTSNS